MAFYYLDSFSFLIIDETNHTLLFIFSTGDILKIFINQLLLKFVYLHINGILEQVLE